MTGLLGKFLKDPAPQPYSSWLDGPFPAGDPLLGATNNLRPDPNAFGNRLYRFGGPKGITPISEPAGLRRPLLCDGVATFSAVGPLPQAPGDSAFAPGVKPANGTVAIAGANTFGFGRKALRDGAASAIKISPIGLEDLLRKTGGPRPPYSVGDYGDKNVRNAPGTRFDIYRFPTIKQANQFGKRTVPVMIQVPAGGRCPPGSYPRQR